MIEGAKDQRTPSACLFPEILKSELRGIRSVIEAYSHCEQMQGTEQASAAGVTTAKIKLAPVIKINPKLNLFRLSNLNFRGQLNRLCMHLRCAEATLSRLAPHLPESHR